jgi:tetrahydromethanopterin S-methyltransferase subunit B
MFSWIIDKILALLAPILKPLQPLITIFTHLKDNTFGIITASTQVVQTAERIFDEIRHFSLQPHIKSRVISLPAAQQHLAALVAAPTQIVNEIKSLVEQLKNKIDPAAFNVEELEGLEDLRSIATKFGSKIAAGFEKVLGIVTLVVDALVTIRSAISSIQSILDSIEEIVTDVSGLDAIFLSQKNPRRSEDLADGGSIKIRVGNLHS